MAVSTTRMNNFFNVTVKVYDCEIISGKSLTFNEFSADQMSFIDSSVTDRN